MEKFRISAVRYANTYPFIYGLAEGGFDKKAVIETDHPAGCAAKLISGRTDIGLVPVAAIPQMKESHIVSDYCIGADGKVRTIQLMSNTPFRDIRKVFLDYRSRTSVNLVKVLAKHKWARDLEWINTSEGFDFIRRGDSEAVVLIGDQCFESEKSFTVKMDLAEEWKEYAGLPFVFACWVSNKAIDKDFIDDFNRCLETGVNNIDKVVQRFGKSGIIKGADLKKYLTENIDFHLDARKKLGMDLFLKLLNAL
jgi:chorismate dehydratase